MSDTKQQCPTCGSTKNWDRNALVGMYEGGCSHPEHNTATDNLRSNQYEIRRDSPVEGSAPSAAGSGLRRQRDLEWDSRKRAKAELTVERTRLDQAYTYLEGMLRLVAPVEPLPDLMGVCTQIDNFIVGERTRREAAERELKELREALQEIESIGTVRIGDLAGSRAKRIARDALRGKGE